MVVNDGPTETFTSDALAEWLRVPIDSLSLPVSLLPFAARFALAVAATRLAPAINADSMSSGKRAAYCDIA
jgi:hypothetical protein